MRTGGVLVMSCLCLGRVEGSVRPGPTLGSVLKSSKSEDGTRETAAATYEQTRPGPAQRLVQRLSPLLQCLLKMAKERPLRFAGGVLASVALHAHIRLQAEKRNALKAFEQLQDLDTYDITIVTTAALPWKTGTAVNALLRTAYLALGSRRVTLCVPWIHPQEQSSVFPGGLTFESPEAQEEYMRAWLTQRDGSCPDFEIRWYPARYDVTRGSILPLGDTTRWANPLHSDLCILEEPEHLNWYHGGRNWRRRFKLVVGIIHTNYIQYASLYQPENVGVVRFINTLVCRCYTDRVVKLSDSLQSLARSQVCNVHGVRSEFIAVGRKQAVDPSFDGGAYFIGKLLWAKGYRLLIDYLAGLGDDGAGVAASGEGRVHVDVYGDGEDAQAIEDAAKKAGVDLRLCGSRDHAEASLHGYKVFVNPSRTEVLSTTTAEALAMGKLVVIERHPSNEFFYRFSNVRTYDTPEGFRKALRDALSSTPTPLTEAESEALSWAGATRRLMEAVEEAFVLTTTPRLADELAHCVHCFLLVGAWHGYAGDWVRKYVFESGPISRQRWLWNERRYRRSTSVTEVVDKSVAVTPVVEGSWEERYSEGAKGSWTQAFQRKGRPAD